MIIHRPGCGCLGCVAKRRQALIVTPPVKHPDPLKHEGFKHDPGESRWATWGRMGGRVGGRRGGQKGGPARAQALIPTRRREIAQRAARVRWGHAPPA